MSILPVLRKRKADHTEPDDASPKKRPALEPTVATVAQDTVPIAAPTIRELLSRPSTGDRPTGSPKRPSVRHQHCTPILSEPLNKIYLDNGNRDPQRAGASDSAR